jgi:hypothetical protein
VFRDYLNDVEDDCEMTGHVRDTTVDIQGIEDLNRKTPGVNWMSRVSVATGKRRYANRRSVDQRGI